MTNLERITLKLEIAPRADPIRGQLSAAGGDEQEEFVGWLGLATAIERLLTPRDEK